MQVSKREKQRPLVPPGMRGLLFPGGGTLLKKATGKQERVSLLDPERPDCWLVYYREVQVGTIARLSGAPVDVDQWGWMLGFYPGTEASESKNGTGATFEAARAGFETALSAFLPTRTEADFQAWRDQRDDRAWKYAMRDRGLRLPTEFADGRAQCFCGAAIDIARCSSHVLNAHRGFEL